MSTVDFVAKQALYATYVGMGVMLAAAATFFAALGYIAWTSK
jgi:hypothetical protein